MKLPLVCILRVVITTASALPNGIQEGAAECHAAKEMALQATTEEATDIALKKVRVFCEG